MGNDKKINKVNLPEPVKINEPAQNQDEFIDKSSIRKEKGEERADPEKKKAGQRHEEDDRI